MKKIIPVFCASMFLALPLFAQTNPCNETTKLTGGNNLSQGMGNLSGSSYHYELWTDAGGAQGANLKWYGANVGGGAAYRAEWTQPDDYLGRIGYYWGNGSAYTTYKNIYVDYNYTRSGRSTAGDYSYIGIYGWSRNNSASNTNERLIEYYIVDDWFGNQWQADNTPITTNTTGGSSIGSFTVDGATYNVVKNTRTGPSIDGNKTFTQIFSIRNSTRKCGTISVTEHYKKWEELGLKLGNLYEAKFLTEAGGGTGWLDLTYLKLSQEDSPRGSGGTTTSSSSRASSSSSRAASSSSGTTHTQATTCKTPLIAYPTNTVPSDPYTACFQYTNGKCYVCKISSEGEFEGNMNTCASGWVWNGSQIDNNLENNYWYQEVTCPAGSSSSRAVSSSSRAVSSSSRAVSSSSRAVSSSSRAASSSSRVSSSSRAVSSSSNGTTPIMQSAIPNPETITTMYYDLKGQPLGNAKPREPGVYIVKEGYLVKKVVVK